MRGRGRPDVGWGVGTWLALVGVLATGDVVDARTLADRLNVLITDNSYLFQGANFDALTPALERIAVQGTDLPATSTVPGVTYTFDVEVGAPVRSSGSLGPVFLEHAGTIGRKRLLVGASYLYADLSNLEGDDASERLFFLNSALGRNSATGHVVRVENRFTFDEFAIRLHGVSLSGTYGITDVWDVNALLPLLRTELDVRATTQNFTRDIEDGNVVVDPARPVSLHDDAFGVGDLLLRTKYALGRRLEVDTAVGFVLRIPTGNEENFQGLGDWTVMPQLVLSRGIGRHDVHASLGMQVNTDDLERSRARYGIGATVQPLDDLAFLVDLIGSSGVADDEFSQRGVALGRSRFDGPFQRETAVARGPTDTLSPVHFSSAVPRTDIVDLAVGMKADLAYRVTVFVSAIVPLTPDGLRADVIPAAGVDYTF